MIFTPWGKFAPDQEPLV